MGWSRVAIHRRSVDAIEDDVEVGWVDGVFARPDQGEDAVVCDEDNVENVLDLGSGHQRVRYPFPKTRVQFEAA